jgi:hypothetical protein
MKYITIATGLLLFTVPAGFCIDKNAMPAGGCPVGTKDTGAGCPSGGGMGGSSAPTMATTGGLKGKVTQTLDAGRYTYVAVDDGTGEKWAAAPSFDVKVGEVVEVQQGMVMKAFHSKSLNRTFPEILFAETIVNVTKNPAPSAVPPEANKPVCGKAEVMAERMNLKKVAPPEGGMTLAEVIQQRAALAGKTVSVRGKVKKFTPNVMGKNWLHLQDGSGADGSADLAVTTDSVVKVGDVVTLTGTVSVNKDFGSGYRYDILVESATVK